jgi:hypothetical protein
VRALDVRLVAPALLGVGVLAAGVVALGDLTGLSPAVPLTALVLVAAAVLVVATRGADALGVGLLVGSVATVPWNAVVVAGLKPGPVMLALALLLLGTRALVLRRRVVVPAWVWVLGGTITLVALVTLVHPPSPGYLAARYVPPELVAHTEAGWPGLVQAIGWLVAAVALPLTVCLAAPLRPGLPGRLASAWALGAAASAAVAVTDDAGVTHVSLGLRGLVDVGGREAGLTVQPTHLAVATALALPVVVWRLTRVRGAWPAAGWAAVGLVMVAGLVVSESRGGLVAAVAAVLVTLAMRRRSRPWLAPLAVLATAIAVVVVVSAPDLVGGAAERLRLAGADSAAMSNQVRGQLGAQAWLDFVHAPVQGIGLEVAVQGHNIWLQLLAAGGALLLLGFLAAVALVGADVTAVRRAEGGLPLVLAICAATWLLVGTVENHLTDLYLYVPFALIAGVRAVAAAPSAPSAPPVPSTQSTDTEAIPTGVAASPGGVRP